MVSIENMNLSDITQFGQNLVFKCEGDVGPPQVLKFEAAGTMDVNTAQRELIEINYLADILSGQGDPLEAELPTDQELVFFLNCLQRVNYNGALHSIHERVQLFIGDFNGDSNRDIATWLSRNTFAPVKINAIDNIVNAKEQLDQNVKIKTIIDLNGWRQLGRITILDLLLDSHDRFWGNLASANPELFNAENMDIVNGSLIALDNWDIQAQTQKRVLDGNELTDCLQPFISKAARDQKAKELVQALGKGGSRSNWFNSRNYESIKSRVRMGMQDAVVQAKAYVPRDNNSFVAQNVTRRAQMLNLN